MIFEAIEIMEYGDLAGNVIIWVATSIIFIVIFQWFYRITKIKKFQWVIFLQFLMLTLFRLSACFGILQKVWWSRGCGRIYLGGFAGC